ncbi:hypothetical protein SCD_n02372 [Sulfuricella denitrificans skB26]|uniref:Uncharacterized protein n=1 Tax=Sulfuricella denitrificans (strain DSM 22764 / NBRC 105220 / skB26) TaxID=1163617 RepID=S6AAR6_SULDS|nr:hypothetical protein SCD_n02372 [Sulfuricella denitrificans skB26]
MNELYKILYILQVNFDSQLRTKASSYGYPSQVGWARFYLPTRLNLREHKDVPTLLDST